MKKTWTLIVVLFATMVSFNSCKPKDADIKSAIETQLKTNPATQNTIVEVKDGIATISGECKDEACAAECLKITKAVKGVKDVVNNCKVAPTPIVPAETVVINSDDALTKLVTDAVKDFPSIKSTVKDGVVSVTGELTAERWKKLKMILDGLNPKKVDASALKIK
ncbi:MAG: BON domain-containing protein [Ferruginibacter sp.]